MRRLAALLVALPLLGGGIAEGNRAYRSGDARRAAEIYARRFERGDSSAVLRYNLGTALLRLGRYEEARPHLEAATGARVRRELRERAHYNAGNTDLEPVFRRRVLENQREARLRRAIARYKAALRVDPADLASKWNLEIAQKLLEKEEQENQDERQDQGGGGGGGGGEPSPPAPQAPQPRPTPGSQSGPSPELSEAEAERILTGAAQQEQDAQRELLNRNRGQRRPVRDW